MTLEKFRPYQPYQPVYSPIEGIGRFLTLTEGLGRAVSQTLQGGDRKIAASVEITDRCNAGCVKRRY